MVRGGLLFYLVLWVFLFTVMSEAARRLTYNIKSNACCAACGGLVAALLLLQHVHPLVAAVRHLAYHGVQECWRGDSCDCDAWIRSACFVRRICGDCTGKRTELSACLEVVG